MNQSFGATAAATNRAAILVCFALKEEAAPFQKAVRAKPGVSVLIVGIGRENAGRAVRALLAAESPTMVLTCGFAGGLDPALKVGDVVYEAADSPPTSEAVSGKLAAAGAKRARFFCADRIATTAAEKAALRGQTGADAVEMESAAIHEACRERGIPCVTVRVISDSAAEDLPLDFNALSKPGKELDFGKLAWAVARSPGKIPALLDLQKKTGFAARRLAAVLEKIISA